MQVWAAVDDSHDGIVDIRLFVREMDAKAFVRQANKKIGFKRYTYRAFDVHDSTEKAEPWRISL